MVGASTGPETPPDPLPPVTIDGGLSKTAIIGFVGQAVIAAGAIISFLGLADTSWVVKTVDFLRSAEAVPVISFGAMIISSGALWWRGRRRQLNLSFLAALLPDRYAMVKGPLHPSVQAAVDQVVQTEGAPIAPDTGAPR